MQADSPAKVTAIINPVLPAFHADPHIAYLDGKYYIYPTTDGFADWGSRSFNVFSSPDLKKWTDEGTILTLGAERDVPWAVKGAWAPAIATKNGKYYFYFTASEHMGVAVADSPTGPFKDIGKPLVDKGDFSCHTIDPMVFVDDDGSAYFYFGNGKCNVVKLNDDMVSFDRAAVQNITPNAPGTRYNEGAFVFKRNGIYYLTWSVNDTRDPNYQVLYATSNSPMGPFEVKDAKPFLSRQGNSIGTGHHSIVKVAGAKRAGDEGSADAWMICFHRFAIPNGDGMHRETCLAPLTFDADGMIQLVVIP